MNGPIILIEDDEDDQFLIERLMSELNISNQLHIFPHGAAALDYLLTTEDTPLLILSDINMPVMDGLILRSKILENEVLRRKSIPFIFLSTSADPTVVRRAYDQMVQGYYRKPAEYSLFKEQLNLIVQYWTHCLHPNNMSDKSST